MIKRYYLDDVLPNDFIEKLLTNHGVDSFRVNEKIFAVSVFTTRTGSFNEIENVTGYTLQQIYDYLGY